MVYFSKFSDSLLKHSQHFVHFPDYILVSHLVVSFNHFFISTLWLLITSGVERLLVPPSGFVCLSRVKLPLSQQSCTYQHWVSSYMEVSTYWVMQSMGLHMDQLEENSGSGRGGHSTCTNVSFSKWDVIAFVFSSSHLSSRLSLNCPATGCLWVKNGQTYPGTVVVRR